ncbi:GyrI-like domain-containing protein [Candidatus Pristimantibacillus sp. PTI5]|uniref:GyrI-like domain-containing protein n=1 Tax=Candidatus Pristimantibacillus sp. PTI5 TaxID=3400422 RepID=UPI003B011D51
MQETITVDLVEVSSFKALAVRTGMTPDKSGTRVAWSKLAEHVPLDDARLAGKPAAYVFIPQQQWNKEVDTLWIGLEVREFGAVPDGIEKLAINGGICASARVLGDEAHMWRVYETMFSWLEQSKDYELDQRDGIFGMETVPLEPLNALTIPYKDIEIFNFTMLYPVRRKADRE